MNDPSPRITIIGDGQMGLVLAAVAAAGDGQPAITLWSHDADEASALAQTRRSARLPHFELDPIVRVTADASRAFHPGGEAAPLVISAVPAQFVRSVWQRLAEPFADIADTSLGVMSVTKGVEVDTLLRPTQVIADVLSNVGIEAPALGVLSGPTIASELARGMPATMIAAAESPDLADATQHWLSSSYLRIYTGDDALGVELAGACKNVIALAAGMLDGLKAGYNAKSALLARGLAEIARLGVALGANRETFFGLAGAGDLATTCFSPEGRNRSCGEALGKGEPLESYLARTASVVEGVSTCAAVVALAHNTSVEMPICETVHAVLTKAIDPIDGITRLMSRELKRERVG
ncbi:MAG: NAD(P)-dependent glycerol-3-phosphate dehydrogenase [Phycisphaerales bacterium]|nr:NAD(P)-dependent glycerol-3-phosphate dehydrogenase [Phycisphaerales bacterium]